MITAKMEFRSTSKFIRKDDLTSKATIYDSPLYGEDLHNGWKPAKGK